MQTGLERVHIPRTVEPFIACTRGWLISLKKEWLGSYRPEKHYMRGPGPKCRERQATAGTTTAEVTHADLLPAY